MCGVEQPAKQHRGSCSRAASGSGEWQPAPRFSAPHACWTDRCICQQLVGRTMKRPRQLYHCESASASPRPKPAGVRGTIDTLGNGVPATRGMAHLQRKQPPQRTSLASGDPRTYAYSTSVWAAFPEVTSSRPGAVIRFLLQPRPFYKHTCEPAGVWPDRSDMSAVDHLG